MNGHIFFFVQAGQRRALGIKNTGEAAKDGVLRREDERQRRLPGPRLVRHHGRNTQGLGKPRRAGANEIHHALDVAFRKAALRRGPRCGMRHQQEIDLGRVQFTDDLGEHLFITDADTDAADRCVDNVRVVAGTVEIGLRTGWRRFAHTPRQLAPRRRQDEGVVEMPRGGFEKAGADPNTVLTCYVLKPLDGGAVRWFCSLPDVLGHAKAGRVELRQEHKLGPRVRGPGDERLGMRQVMGDLAIHRHRLYRGNAKLFFGNFHPICLQRIGWWRKSRRSSIDHQNPACARPGICGISQGTDTNYFRGETKLNQRAFVIVGLAVAFGAGYLVAAWQGNMLPWQKESRPAMSAAPRTPNLPGGIGTLPNVGSPTPSGQPIPQTGGLSSIPVGDPARQGDMLFAQRRYQEAIPLYQKAVEKNPKDVDSWNDLGLSLHYAGRSDEALQALRKGAETEPLYQRIWLTLGFVALNRQRLEEAKGALNQAINIDPTTGIAAEARKFLQKIP